VNVNPKITAAGLAGALTTIILLIAEYAGLTHIHGEQAAAIVTVIMFIAGYLRSQGDWTPKP